MKVALVSEGTYPFAVGGVSTWCDQLIRGFPEYQWEMVALTVDGGERPAWGAPGNLARVHRIPLWGSPPAGTRRPAGPGRLGWGPLGWLGGRGRVSRPGSAFTASYQSLLTAMLERNDPRSDQAMVARSRFLLALRGIHEYAASGGDLVAAMNSNAGIAQLVSAWEETQKTKLTLADALEAANVMEHMLRPLAAPPLECDLVHASMNGLSMLPAMTAKWRFGTPVVMSEHGIYLREQYLALLDKKAPYAVKVLMLGFSRALAGAGYLIADALAPHSSYNRRWQLQNGGDPDRMWTMYNGVEPEAFPVAEREPDHPTLVFMGRINPLKDVHTLIRAFAHVRTRMPNARLRIFGAAQPADVQYAKSCQRLINDLGLSGSAAMEGSVESPVTAYHAATVVALTSVSEGFPVTIVEAMACGRPMVATNVGGVSEAIADAGIVVAPQDYMAVANACVTLLGDDDLRHRMAKAARSRVLRLFTLGESLDAYRRLYDHLTGATTPPREIGPTPPPAPPPLAPPPSVPLAVSLSASSSQTRPHVVGRLVRPQARGRAHVGAGDPR
jgi:glycosyltransferase involved in cell wall biosynthesis